MKLIAIVNCTLRGIGNVPGYGTHPGTIPLLVFLSIATVAGGWLGFGLIAVMWGPLYLWGAYQRGAAK